MRVLHPFYLLIAFLLLATTATGQVNWCRSIGGDSLRIEIKSLYAVSDDDIVVTGTFTGVFDLNEASTFEPLWIESELSQDSAHETSSCFIARMRASGEFTNSMVLNTDNGALAEFYVAGLTPSGDLIVVFHGQNMNVDVDPGSVEQNVYMMETETNVGVYSSDGELVRFGTIGGTDVWNIDVYSDGIYATFSSDTYSPVDLDFGPGATMVNVPVEVGRVGILAKYDFDMNLLWHKVFGSDSYSWSISHSVHELNDGRVVWAVQTTDGVADMDPGASVTTLSDQGGLIIYDPDGNYLDSYVFGPGTAHILRIEQMTSGEVRMVGTLDAPQDPVDFDVKLGQHLMTSLGRNMFIASYDSDFNLNWVNVASGPGSVGNFGLAVVNVTTATNTLAFHHQGGEFDLDATFPGFYPVVNDGYTVVRTSSYGAPIVHFATPRYDAAGFSPNNSTAFLARNRHSADPEFQINGVSFPFQLAPLSRGTQIANCALDSVGELNGSMYLDTDNNGSWDGSEMPYTDGMIRCLQTSGTTGVDLAGDYRMSLVVGIYQMEVVLPLYHIISSGQAGSFDVSIAEDSVTTIEAIGIYPIPNITDLKVHVAPTLPCRPGFQNQILVSVENVGTIAADAIVTLTSPQFGNVVGSLPAAAIQSVDSTSWFIEDLEPYNSLEILVTFVTDTNVELIGENAIFEANAYPVNEDEAIADNHALSETQVVGSYDPNDKSVVPSSALPDSPFALGNGALLYLIRFQNTGNYPTSFVHVIDTLSNDLDMATFRMISSSHPCEHSMSSDRVITWGFDSLALPDSASDPQGSNGYILFSIELVEGGMSNNEVENKAYIYFDFNPPIITPSAFFELDFPVSIPEEGNSHPVLFPNPTSGIIRFKLPLDSKTPTRVNLVDLMGKEVLSLPYQPSLDFSGLPEGVYFCTLLDDKETLYSMKVVVQRKA